MHTEKQLKAAVKQATAQHFCDPVEYARSKRDEAGKRKIGIITAYGKKLLAT